MKHACIVAVLAFGMAAPAAADVTIRQTTNGRGLGMSGQMTGITYIRGHRMRTDVIERDRTRTTIFDLDTQKMYSFDSKKKEADVWDMAAVAADVAKSVDVSSLKATITPNGQNKSIADQTASGYDMSVSMTAGMAGSKDLDMTVTLAGPLWVVTGAPGTDDYVGFYRAAAEKGWIFGDPRAAKGPPGQARAMSEMYNRLAELGGIAYETDVQIKMGGSGPMASLMSRMGNITMTTVVQSVETTPLADELFAPPAGYKLNEKK